MYRILPRGWVWLRQQMGVPAHSVDVLKTLLEDHLAGFTDPNQYGFFGMTGLGAVLAAVQLKVPSYAPLESEEPEAEIVRENPEAKDHLNMVQTVLSRWNGQIPNRALSAAVRERGYANLGYIGGEFFGRGLEDMVIWDRAPRGMAADFGRWNAGAIQMQQELHHEDDLRQRAIRHIEWLRTSIQRIKERVLLAIRNYRGPGPGAGIISAAFLMMSLALSHSHLSRHIHSSHFRDAAA